MRNSEEVCKAMQIMLFASPNYTLLRHYSFKNYITLTLRWIHGNDSKHHDKCVMMEPWEEENNWPYLYSYRILLLEDILRSALRDYIFIISFARL